MLLDILACVVESGSGNCTAGLFWLHLMRLCSPYSSKAIREGKDGSPGEVWAEYHEDTELAQAPDEPED